MKTDMGTGSPWSAPKLTRAQRALLKRYDILVSTRCAMDRDGCLWEPCRGGGRNREHHWTWEERRAVMNARAEWNGWTRGYPAPAAR
jgi:hypothetical protein